ncbi:MAG: EamA family transporter [bacterium]
MAASLVWAFSFGLIKGYLVEYDPLVVAGVRLLISLLLFLPWLGRQRLPWSLGWRAAGLGGLQFGLMYCCYIASYRYLPAYGVAFFTIFTPLYVAWLHDASGRRWRWRHSAAALLAVGGGWLVLGRELDLATAWPGIVLLQLANVCFAVGQLGYRRLRRQPAPEMSLLGWMYLGASVVTALTCLFWADWTRADFDGRAVLVLLYLGAVPTAIGFALWNKGAASTRPGLLAVCNNLKIPLAVVCSWLIFGETAEYLRVLFSLTVLVAALFLAGRGDTDPPTQQQNHH